MTRSFIQRAATATASPLRNQEHDIALTLVVVGEALPYLLTAHTVGLGVGEANPLIAAAVAAVGWAGVAATVGVVPAFQFLVFRWVATTGRFRIARVGMWGAVALGLFNLAHDGFVVAQKLAIDPRLHDPQWAAILTAGGCGAGAVVVGMQTINARARLTHWPRGQTARAVGLSALLVVALPAGVAFLGTQPIAGSGGTASAASAPSTEWSDEKSELAYQPAAASGTGDVYVPFKNLDTGQSRVVQYDSSGTQIRSVDISGSPTQTAVDPDTGRVFVSHTNGLTAIDNDGTVAWTAGPAVDLDYNNADDQVIVGDGSTLKILDATDGSEVSSYSYSESIDEVHYDEFTGNVIVSISQGGDGIYDIFSIDPTDGSENWRVQKSYEVRAIATTEDTLFVGDGSGSVHGIAAGPRSNTFSTSLGDGYVLNDIETNPETGDAIVGEYDTGVHLVNEAGTVEHTWADYNTSKFIRGLELDSKKQRFYTVTGNLNSPVDAVYGVNTGVSIEPDISGRITDQGGAGVSNATVKIYGAKRPTYEDALEELSTAADPIPPQVAELDGLQLLGDGGRWTDADGKYAGLYSPDNLGTSPWSGDTADLTTPKVRNIEPDSELKVVVGDPTQEGRGVGGIGTGPLGQEYDRQVPGRVSSGTVIITPLGSNGDQTEALRVETNQTLSTGSAFGISDPSELSYGTVELTAGYYLVSVEGSSVSYPIRVGEPRAIIDQYRQTAEGEFTDAAQQIRSALQNDVLVSKTVKTDSEGYYEAQLGSGVRAVQVQSYKAPAADIDPESLTLQSVREKYDAEDPPEASVYFPTRVKRVSVPSQNVDLRMAELTWPPASNLTNLQGRLQELEQRLQRSVQSQLEKRLPAEANETLEELRTRYRTLAGLVRANPVLREAYLEFSDREKIPTASELTEAELREEIATLNRALAATSSTGEVVADPPDMADETLSQQWTLTGFDLADANTTVIAHWSNGTTAEVPEQYVTVNDDTITDGGTISVEDYPLGNASAASVNFEVVAAGPGGYASGQQQVTNPNFDGELPALDAVVLNSLEPGAGERVEATYRPAEDSSFRRVTDATVFAPDGSELDASVENGDTVTFTAGTPGTHTVKATIETTGGQTVTQTTRVSAAATDVARPPSLRAKSSPLGVIAIAGDGLDSGSVDTSGERLDITAQLPEDNSAPSRVHVYTDTLTGATSRPVDIQVVRGESQRALNQHVYVDLHAKSLPSGAYTYRVVEGDNQPLPLGGESQYGSVSVRPNGTTISTYTEADGSVTIEPIPSPSFTDQIRWQLNQIEADLGGVSPLQAAPARIGATAPTAAAP